MDEELAANTWSNDPGEGGQVGDVNVFKRTLYSVLLVMRMRSLQKKKYLNLLSHFSRILKHCNWAENEILV